MKQNTHMLGQVNEFNFKNMKYFDELKRSMDWLNEKSDTLFLGQAVEYAGTAMTNTLKDVNKNKLLEMPVNEDMQMGMTIGMALNGTIPISIYPRWNFLLLAANQVINHLDKIKIMSDGGYTPKVIIRTSIGAQRPLHPQHQHIADFTSGFKAMCDWVDIIRLDEPHQIFESFKYAYERTDNRPTILVEWGDYYGEK
jgi:pyruvate/2-oxoglutarate/acetoin dehydrogenase E1 component